MNQTVTSKNNDACHPVRYYELLEDGERVGVTNYNPRNNWSVRNGRTTFAEITRGEYEGYLWKIE